MYDDFPRSSGRSVGEVFTLVDISASNHAETLWGQEIHYNICCHSYSEILFIRKHCQDILCMCIVRELVGLVGHIRSGRFKRLFFNPWFGGNLKTCKRSGINVDVSYILMHFCTLSRYFSVETTAWFLSKRCKDCSHAIFYKIQCTVFTANFDERVVVI